MAKEATKVNSKGEQGKILEAQVSAAPTPTVAGKGKAKKNQSIAISYHNAAGEEVPNGGDVVSLKVQTKAGERVIDLTKLPKPMLVAAAVMGLNTTIRNAHNSTENGGGDGPAAAFARINSILAGEWRTAGEAGDEGIPLVIEAMIKAKKDKNLYTDNMEQKWLDEYRGLNKEGKAEWTKAMRAKKPIEVAYLQIQAERAAKKAQAAMGEAAGDGEDF